MQQQTGRDCSTVAQLILSIVGMLVYGAAAVLFITAGFSGEGATPSLTDSVPSLALGCVAIACLILLIPSFVLSIQSVARQVPSPGLYPIIDEYFSWLPWDWCSGLES